VPVAEQVIAARIRRAGVEALSQVRVRWFLRQFEKEMTTTNRQRVELAEAGEKAEEKEDDQGPRDWKTQGCDQDGGRRAEQAWGVSESRHRVVE